MKEPLLAAMGGGYAIPGFNFFHQSSAEGIAEEAEARRSPVFLMISGVYARSLGVEVAAAMGRRAAEKVSTPVALHLDHGDGYELAEACVRAGFTSVMIDGSRLPLAENIALTKKVVAMAHPRGVTVEAEIGEVGGVEDAVYEEGGERKLALADPGRAAEFVETTGVDCLAPAIGNVHGLTKREPRLDFALLARVRAAVPIPLAMHGGTGISDDGIRRLVRGGMAKINVGTELKVAWRRGLIAFFEDGGYEPRLAMLAAKAEIRKTVAWKIGLAGSEGKV
jgi:ketose-bisphosphate aldolase